MRQNPVTLSVSPQAAALLAAVRQAASPSGPPAFLVGGLVRDALLGRPTGDVDVAYGGDPAALARNVAATLDGTLVTLDAERQVYRVLPKGAPGACVDISPLRGAPPSLDADAFLRDFTVNALAVPLDTLDPGSWSGQVVDATGGLEDLEHRVLRAVSPSAFQDDPARLLRAMRLAVELGFTIEEQAAGLIRRDAAALAKTSPERVRDEFCRILNAPGAAGNLRLLDGLGLLTQVLPELEEARACQQPKEHYWDVLQHSLEAAGAVEQVLRAAPADPAVLAEAPWDAGLAAHFQEPLAGDRTRALALKLAALLHDVAKPASKTIEPTGRIRFFGHPSRGAAMTGRILERLRFSNREARAIVVMVKEHLRPSLISRGEEGPTRRAVYRYFRDADEVVVDTLFLAMADYLAAKGPMVDLEDWRQHAAKLRGILEQWRQREQYAAPPKLLDGHDLMREFHLEPGPRLRVLLEAVRESHAAGEIATREEALALAARLLDRQEAAA